MKPLQRASIPDSEKALIVADLAHKWIQGDATVRELIGPDATPETIEIQIAKTIQAIANEYCEEVYLNDRYQVAKRTIEDGRMVHLSIKRVDREPIHDWRDLQAIKNMLVGPECEAIEIYPAESRLVDTANQYHLWVFTDETYRIPVGFTGGRATTNNTIGKSNQRPMEG